MPKAESYTVGILPLALAAGLFSGSYFRQSPATEPPQPPEKPVETAAGGQATPSSHWLSDLEPVMRAIAEAMGVPVLRDMTSRARSAGVSGQEEPSLETVRQAVDGIRNGLERCAGNTSCGCENDPDLASFERLLTAHLLSERERDESGRTRLTTIAEATLDELEDWRALRALAGRAKQADPANRQPSYEVEFIVATVPDYVDSNSGWLADQSLTALQAAMSRADYLLDRFRLIDWTRNDPRTGNAALSDSVLHERQPGALIFRQIKKEIVRLQVVLLALETPTSGVHRAALRNAISFVRSWNRCSSQSSLPLRLLGPTFSGSVFSMARTLGDKDDGFLRDFEGISVISGSATADGNLETFNTFAHGVEYNTTVQPTSRIQEAMAAFLRTLNRSWDRGEHVAILRESNTAYGADNNTDGPFDRASVFTFPMHVAQLRSDSPIASAPSITLLPTGAIPLIMKETAPAADQIPALRPQLTSPVVESTVATILDAIQHERFSAVGIQATDDRDVLFLAREVKRAAPDVQLFLMGGHSLYLHPDYVPYLRGTLVASSYGLSLTTQADFRSSSSQRTREPFQSMAAQGLFNAALILLSEKDRLLDYCQQGRPVQKGCAPPVSISVIGEDGFWPLPGVPQSETPLLVPLRVDGFVPRELELPPLPVSARIVVTLLAVFIICHVLMLVFIRTQLEHGTKARIFLRWPLLRVLTPPSTYASAAHLHSFARLICFCLLALLAAWTTTIALPFLIPSSRFIICSSVAVLVAAAVMVPAAQLTLHARRHPIDVPEGMEEARQRTNHLKKPMMLLLATSGLSFIVYVAGLLKSGSDPAASNLTLERVVGGGIVSPALATICLFAALYTGLFSGMRRLSLVGFGYSTLETKSQAFRLLIRGQSGSPTDDRGNPEATVDGAWHQRGRLSDVLDMPAQNLPLSHICGIILAVVIAAFSLLKVSTIDGRAFTWFLCAASVTCLMIGLVSLTQGLAIWNTARAHLKRLAQSPIEGSFESIAHLVPWDLSLVPPRLIDLRPVAERADEIASAFLMLERRAMRGDLDGSEDRGSASRTRMDDRNQVLSATALPVRAGDIAGVTFSEAPGCHLSTLEREIEERQYAFAQSSSWSSLWKVADRVVELLGQTTWHRSSLTRRSDTPAARALPAVLSIGGLSQVEPEISKILKIPMASVPGPGHGAESTAQEKPAGKVAGWVRSCEELVALLFAFVLRDIVARTLGALFTSMLCLIFLTASHLLYSFNGRSALLTVDLLAVAAVAVVSISILVGIERDTVISRLRKTTPGRLDLNWAFVHRVAIYGVLPLLIVIASLFPEIGTSIFGWVEPLRKLASH